MKTVKAIRKFDHGGMKRPGDEFQVSDQQAAQLEARKLVTIVGGSKSNPTPAAGQAAQSSASQAAPASQPKTVNKSGRGGRKPAADKKPAAGKKPATGK